MQQNCIYPASRDQRTKPTTTPKAARTTAAAPQVTECTPLFAAGVVAAGLAGLLDEPPAEPPAELPAELPAGLPDELPPEPAVAGDPELPAAPAVLEAVELP